MKPIRFWLLAILLFGFSHVGLNAQEAIPAAGGEAKGFGGTVSYTVGQLLYQTHSKNTGSVAQGVQQPFEILELTGVGSIPGIDLQCIVFPNPVMEYVQLRIENHSLNDLSYQLYDLKGKLILSRNITGDLTSIPMSTLGASTYIIRVTRNSEEIKAFKIIKK